MAETSHLSLNQILILEKYWNLRGLFEIQEELINFCTCKFCKIVQEYKEFEYIYSFVKPSTMMLLNRPLKSKCKRCCQRVPYLTNFSLIHSEPTLNRPKNETMPTFSFETPKKVLNYVKWF